MDEHDDHVSGRIRTRSDELDAALALLLDASSALSSFL